MSGVWIFQLFSVVLILICPCIGTFTCRHCVFCLPKADPTEINYAGEVFGYHIHRCPVSGEPEYFLLSQILFLYPDKLDTLDLSPIPCYKECRSCVQIIQKSCTSVKPLAGVYWKELYQGLFHQTATNATPATSSQSTPPTAANQSDSTLAKPSGMCGNNITVIINNVNSHSNNNTVVIDNSNCGHCGDTGGNVVITNTNSDNNVNMLTIKRNSNNETRDKATIPVTPSGSSEDPLADIIVQHHQGQVDKPATPTGSSDDQPVHVKKHQEAQFSSFFARSVDKKENYDIDPPVVYTDDEPDLDFKKKTLDDEDRVFLPPQPAAVLIASRKRNRLIVQGCLLVTSLLVVCLGVLFGIYMYRHFARTQAFYGQCGVRGDGYEMMEQIETDQLTYEKIDVPAVSDFRKSTILHDFEKNYTAIVDKDSWECFVMPLNHSTVKPPKDFWDLITKLQSGYYMPDEEVVKENYRIVEPPVSDLSPFGYYIWRECRRFVTYRLQRLDETPMALVKREACLTKSYLYSAGVNMLKIQTMAC